MVKVIQKMANRQQFDTRAAVTCNYQNNYYGDQVCVVFKPVNVKR